MLRSRMESIRKCIHICNQFLNKVDNQLGCYRLKVLSSVFTVLVGIGCFIQVLVISKQYSEYRTTTVITQYMPDFMIRPNLVICARYIDILDTKRLFRDTKIQVGQSVYLKDNKRAHSSLTLRQLFDYTPNCSEIMSRCLFRKPGSHQLFDHRNKFCYEEFNMTKFYLQEFICYRFNPILLTSFNMQIMSTDLYYSNLFYAVEISPTVLPVLLMRIIIFYPTTAQDEPDFSKRFALSFNRGNKNKSFNPTNVFSLDFLSQEVTRMPLPYENGCLPGGLHGMRKSSCFTECLLKKVKERFGRIPFGVISVEPSDLRMLSEEQLDDPETNNRFQSTEKECYEICRFIDCGTNYSIPSGTQEYWEDNDQLQFKVGMPRIPNQKIEFKAVYTTVDYVVYILSSLGIWCGISVMAFNPFRALLLRKHKRQKLAKRFSAQRLFLCRHHYAKH